MSAKTLVAPPPRSHIRQIVQTALEEDLGFGDLTSSALLSPDMIAKAQIMAKQAMVVAGMTVAEEVFHQIDDTLTVKFHQRDGDWVGANTRILTITGNAQSLLQAERVALNFIQRLSGISTITHQFCHAVHNHSVKIADTRKTTPGLRALEKWAVRLGGGVNHRFSLHDGILIKDNHLMVLSAHKMSLSQACRLARQEAPHGLRISVEVESMEQVRQALQGKADVILLDNRSPSKIQEAVEAIKGKALVEVSGGVTMNNIRDIAKTGVDIISIGALTHSAPAMDLSMDIIPSGSQRKTTRQQTRS
ncbi:MAG: carboxylating nicotinate-nucleotide diphosphorylase [Nitrospirota bacterium]|nr:carboxylating nicotinate-nucleotide diphosphorylase [Nitrospirota bacterium]MDX2419616.1 carboxylating nicotinate-nucleotide diphosphorylase [Nitrospirota bacterium]